ncbi:hypothetical protein K9M42_03425 [Patescibacteria group bacterium]|nr:hypothetical protein [Patescibacteria group bacterium]
MSSIKFTEQNKTDFYPNFEDKYKTTSALGLAYIDYVYVNQCEKESNHLTNNNNQFEDLFVVEKRKGE